MVRGPDDRTPVLIVEGHAGQRVDRCLLHEEPIGTAWAQAYASERDDASPRQQERHDACECLIFPLALRSVWLEYSTPGGIQRRHPHDPEKPTPIVSHFGGPAAG